MKQSGVKQMAVRLARQARIELGDYPVDAAFSSDGRALVVAGGEGALLWVDVATAQSDPVPLGSHAGGALAVVWQSAGMLFASSGQDGEVRLWDARSRESRCIHSAAVWSEQLAFSANGKLLAVATGKQLNVYDCTGQEQALFTNHAGAVAAIAWRPKANELAAVFNGGACVHRLAPPTQSLELPWKGACLTAAWSFDGRVLASGLQDGSVHFWYVAAGKQSEMKGYGVRVKHTSWSANGRYLATAADESIVVWEFAGRGPEGSEPLQLRAHTARVTQLAFAPQGSLLASAAQDRRLLIWLPGAGDAPLEADLLTDEIVLVRWSRDGQHLAVADRSGALTIYAIYRSAP
jgi:WD40 repeat protein